MKRHGLLSDDPEVAKRLNVGMVFQNGALFDSLTVGENVGFLLYEHTDLPHERIEVQYFPPDHPMLAKFEHTHLAHDRIGVQYSFYVPDVKIQSFVLWCLHALACFGSTFQWGFCTRRYPKRSFPSVNRLKPFLAIAT